MPLFLPDDIISQMDLSKKKCIPCQGGEKPQDRKVVEEYLRELKAGWLVYDNYTKIKKEFEFKVFGQALEFVNEVGKLAEIEGHHPNLYLHSYNKVLIELWTHKINGLHENDFILAAKIDNLTIPSEQE